MATSLYDTTTFSVSEVITKKYSTSFYLASKLFNKSIKKDIFSIYGFVRFADEIVDTFHGFDKKYLINKFEEDYYDSIKHGISLNPVLHSFQLTVKKYNISDAYVQAFLSSMKFDLEKKEYVTRDEINEYIYGSADVVGLMCLKVFCEGNEDLFNELKPSAIKLGSAFQKVNFLRDLKNDIENLDRKYFPEITRHNFTEVTKTEIINDIKNDFQIAFSGIKKLPHNSRLAVFMAYSNYFALLKKISITPAHKIVSKRLRISNFQKILLLFRSILFYKLKLV